MIDRRTVGWRVAGRVQGVGFRWFVLEAARACRVEGDVRNLPDGRVEVRARGEEGQLAELLRALRAGPAGSRVDSLESFIIGDPPFMGFEIRR